jgi:K+/H+ antiporter YhaU regulatory subunit KhtT
MEIQEDIMSLWEKIKSGLDEGLETISEKTIEMSQLIRLKWERRSIEKDIDQALMDLGDMVYQLHVSKKQDRLHEVSKPHFDKVGIMEKQLEEKEGEIEDLTDKIDKKQVKGLKKDLEMGDGTIAQIVVDEDSTLANKTLMEIKFPKAVLIGTIVREEQVIIPDGKTVLHTGDKVTLLGKKEDVEAVVHQLSRS